jgi:quercetin dioxygenase-like cupin family protein
MQHFHYNQIKTEDEQTPAKGVKVRWLIDEKKGAPNFSMRLFEVETGGNTPYHKHAWEHEVFILEGEGLLIDKNMIEIKVKPWDVILVEPGEKHCFRNPNQETFKFLCLIPHGGKP